MRCVRTLALALNCNLLDMQGGGRTGKGSAHRQQKAIVWLSLPVVLLLIIAAGVGLYLTFAKVLGAGAPDNYTLGEIAAARFWCALRDAGFTTMIVSGGAAPKLL